MLNTDKGQGSSLGGCVVNSVDSGYEPLAGSCEQGNEPSNYHAMKTYRMA